MTYPLPLPPPNLNFYWVLFGEFPQVGISDDVGPEDSQEASEASVDECLQFVDYGGGDPPGF